MENVVWKVLAFILCALLLFLAPLMSFLERQDDIAYNIVFTECSRFADSCRDTGYITADMVSEFLQRLRSTGNSYNISMSHIKRSIHPVYRMIGGTLQPTGEFDVVSVAAGETEILAYLFPDSPASRDNKYVMKMGDLFFVEVSNKGKTMAAALRDMMFFSETRAPSIFVRTGGMVRNEAY